MERKVRVAQYGAGRMSRWLMRYVLEHEGELVAAFCRNPSHIGRDVSEIIGNDYPFVGVAVQPLCGNLGKFLASPEREICACTA